MGSTRRIPARSLWLQRLKGRRLVPTVNSHRGDPSAGGLREHFDRAGRARRRTRPDRIGEIRGLHPLPHCALYRRVRAAHMAARNDVLESLLGGRERRHAGRAEPVVAAVRSARSGREPLVDRPPPPSARKLAARAQPDGIRRNARVAGPSQGVEPKR